MTNYFNDTCQNDTQQFKDTKSVKLGFVAQPLNLFNGSLPNFLYEILNLVPSVRN